MQDDTPSPQGLKRRASTIGVSGFVLVTYLALLLGITYLAQRELIDESRERYQLDLELRAAALSYFYAERYDDLDSLRNSSALETFYANRALGMSMEYGLRSSLLNVRSKLNALRDTKRIAGQTIYQRLVLYDEAGKALVDSATEEPTALPWPEDAAGNTHSIRVLLGGDSDSVAIVAPVRFKGRPMGTLVAWIDASVPLERLASKHRGHSDFSEMAILAGGGNLARQPDEHHIAQVEGTPFRLVGTPEAAPYGGILTSGWFLAALTLLALILLAGGLLLLRINNQNLVLHTRMEADRRQRLELREHNLRLASEIRKREEYEQRLIYQANYDVLTGLPNRALATDRLTQSLVHAKREHLGVTVMFLDLDLFKQVNDTLGHAAGDELLVQAAHRLHALVAEGDTVARLGGDEFLLLFTDLHEGSCTDSLARRVLESFTRPFELDGREYFVSASIGIATFPNDGTEAEILLKNADMALYQAKDAGRGTYRFYAHSHNERVREDVEIANHLRRAAERDELHLVYQPFLELSTNRIVAAEALLRWTSDKLGVITPDRFIPIAEGSGLIQELGTWVLEQACADARLWQQIQPCRVSVNVSSIQLQEPSAFRQTVTDAIRRSRLAPGQLELELTERVLLKDSPQIKELLDELAAGGVQLSVDDFGPGYSALSYLRRYPFHVLKIDRSFISGIVKNAEDAELTRAMIAMAQALGLEVLAEGVETAAQAEFLRRHGCNLAQGMYFGRPMLSDEFLAFLQTNTRTREHRRVEPTA